MNATRQHVEIAHGIVVAAHADADAGKLTQQQAQQMASRLIAALRYDGSEYFWINDLTPRMVVHPIKPELDGKDIGDIRDPNGLALFSAFVAKVKSDGKGFVSYQWPKPGSAAPVDKISYVQGFAPWGWVIGSGIYVGDLQYTVRTQLIWVGGVVVLALLVSAYLFLSSYYVMDGGLKETRRHLRAMTAGDLTTSPTPWGNDEAAQLMTELRNMQVSLRQMVLRVRSSSEDIVRSSSEIADGAMELSSRTESAAASLEQSAASMQEISATVSSTSSNTAEAAKMARHNATMAAEGGRVMQDVIVSMDSIGTSSAKITDIIGTIDGIAFQTNILALNAAVEATPAPDDVRALHQGALHAPARVVRTVAWPHPVARFG